MPKTQIYIEGIMHRVVAPKTNDTIFKALALKIYSEM